MSIPALYHVALSHQISSGVFGMGPGIDSLGVRTKAEKMGFSGGAVYRVVGAVCRKFMCESKLVSCIDAYVVSCIHAPHATVCVHVCFCVHVGGLCVWCCLQCAHLRILSKQMWFYFHVCGLRVRATCTRACVCVCVCCKSNRSLHSRLLFAPHDSAPLFFA